MDFDNHYMVMFKDDSETVPLVFEGTKELVSDWLIHVAVPDTYKIYNPRNRVYFSVPEFEKMVKTPKFVPKFYKMNPETDDLLPSGRHLANGMVVLISNPDSRANITTMSKDWEIDRAHVNNRWCTVSQLQVTGHTVRFVGVYEDGTKRLRDGSVLNGWFVKNSSIDDSLALTINQFDTVRSLVVKAMTIQSKATRDNSTSDMMHVSEDITREILEALK